jgi:two-component sensor histidine kinase
MGKIWLICLMLICTLSYAQEASVINDLKEKLSEDLSTEKKLELYNDLAWEYYSTNFDSSSHYTDLALTLAAETESTKWRAISMEMKAILYEISGRPDEALKLYLEVIPLRNEIGGEGLENTFNNMAIIFRLQGDYEKALEYFRKSHEIEIKKENKIGRAESLNNIAITFRYMGKNDTVPELLKEALRLSTEMENDRVAMHTMINLADWYYLNDLKDSALYYYEKAIPLSVQIDDQASTCVVKIGMADVLTSRRDFERAEQEYKFAYDLALDLNTLDYQSRVHRGLANLYKEKKEYQRAVEEMELFLEIEETIRDEEMLRITSDMEQKYQSVVREQEIAELELAAIEQNLAAAKNQNQRRLLFLLAILLLGILGFVTYRFFNQRKVALILRGKNETIAEALSERELLLREIHHRVKNNLQVVSSLLSIQGREIEDARAKDAISESKNRVHSMALIHQFLYSDKELASIDMQEYIPSLCTKLFNAYRLDHDLIDLKTDVENISLDIDTAIPLGIIINELITNSLKYAFTEGEEGSILVSFTERQNKLVLRVKDSGSGKKSDDRSDISFGMKLIRAFEEKLQAEIEILDTDGYEVICTIGKYKRHWPKNTES